MAQKTKDTKKTSAAPLEGVAAGAAKAAIARPDTNKALTKIGAALSRKTKMKPEVARAIKILKRTRELFVDEGRWVKHTWAQVRKRGSALEGKFCIEGGLRYVALGEPKIGYDLNVELRGHTRFNHDDKGLHLAESTLERILPGGCIPNYNDDTTTTVEDVARLFDKALKKLTKDGK